MPCSTVYLASFPEIAICTLVVAEKSLAVSRKRTIIAKNLSEVSKKEAAMNRIALFACLLLVLGCVLAGTPAATQSDASNPAVKGASQATAPADPGGQRKMR